METAHRRRICVSTTSRWRRQSGRAARPCSSRSASARCPHHCRRSRIRTTSASPGTKATGPWKEAGHERESRVSVSRSIFPIVNSTDRAYFGAESRSTDQVGFIDGGAARFGKTYAGELDQLVKELAGDEAIAAADTLLLTIPNQLGVDYNAHLLESIVRHVAPELGWR